MDIVVPELANAMYQDRMREATRARRMFSPRPTAGLASMLSHLLHRIA